MNYFKWYKVKLKSGEEFIGSPYMLPSGKNYDFWYIDYTTIKSKIIPVSEVVSMKEVE